MHTFVHYDYSLGHLKQIRLCHQLQSLQESSVFALMQKPLTKTGTSLIFFTFLPSFNRKFDHFLRVAMKVFLYFWAKRLGNIPNPFLLALILPWFLSNDCRAAAMFSCVVVVIFLFDLPLFMFRYVASLSYFLTVFELWFHLMVNVLETRFWA